MWQQPPLHIYINPPFQVYPLFLAKGFVPTKFWKVLPFPFNKELGFQIWFLMVVIDISVNHIFHVTAPNIKLLTEMLGFPKINLKLLSAIFVKFLFFHQMIGLQKLWKLLFISSTKLFSFSRYSIFCISILPSFSACRSLL